IEAPDFERQVAGLGIKKASSLMTAKRDGSLGNYGWELVTQPVSPELWLKPRIRFYKEKLHGCNASVRIFHMIKALKALGYKSHDGGRCGMHFHISQTAFFKEGEAFSQESDHFHWFRRLVNGELFGKLSMRADFYYCRRSPEAVAARGYRQTNRYE